jgi:hypothetical protein
MKVYVMTQRVHYAGMNQPEWNCLGVFSTAEKAWAAAEIESWCWQRIADFAEVTECQLDEYDDPRDEYDFDHPGLIAR